MALYRCCGGVNLSKATKVYTDTGTPLQKRTWNGATVGKTYLMYGFNQMNTASLNGSTGMDVIVQWSTYLGERGTTSGFPVFYIGKATSNTIGILYTRGIEIYQLD